jgi:hypothetical protein
MGFEGFDRSKNGHRFVSPLDDIFLSVVKHFLSSRVKQGTMLNALARVL